MPEQRVSDERLVQIMDGWPDVEWGQLAADLRDARALLAQVEPVVRFCCGEFHGTPWAFLRQLGELLDALPESVRKEYGTPPIDWDAPADPPAPAKDGAE